MTDEAKDKPILVSDDKNLAKPVADKLGEGDKALLKEIEKGVLAKGAYAIKTTDELMAMCRAAGARKKGFNKLCERIIDGESKAKMIKMLRCEEGGTWRWVAERAYELLLGEAEPEWYPPSNQLMGMALCERAAAILGEDPNVYPWN